MMMEKMKTVCVVCVFLTLGCVGPASEGEHSLFYTYTALSKPLNLPGIYEFIAMGTLDDQMIDYYSSETQVKVPQQDWMREKLPADYWEKENQSCKRKEQWLKVMLENVINHMGHNKTDLHVLQWRQGCVVEEATDGNITFVRGVSEYSYDGTDFLSFDVENSSWIAAIMAAEPTKKKWDKNGKLNEYTKYYLEKECVDWITKFMDYRQEQLRKHSPPDVRVFAQKSVTDSSRLTLTCLATGFYSTDVHMVIRKFKTSLPEHLLSPAVIRPNGDGTYQLRKSVEITEKDKALYDCYVTHSTFKEPIITQLNSHPSDPSLGIYSGFIGAVVGVLVVGGVFFYLKKKLRDRTQAQSNEGPPAAGTGQVIVPFLTNPVDPNDIGHGSSEDSAYSSLQSLNQGNRDQTEV